MLPEHWIASSGVCQLVLVQFWYDPVKSFEVVVHLDGLLVQVLVSYGKEPDELFQKLHDDANLPESSSEASAVDHPGWKRGVASIRIKP